MRYLILGAIAAGLSGCDSPAEPVKPDTTPPSIAIVVQSDGGPADEDGLIEFAVNWASRDVDVAATTITDLSEGTAYAGVNLFQKWNVTAADSLFVVVEKPPFVLRGGGTAIIEIGVRDTAGNVTRDTVSFELPYAKLVRTITTGRQANFTDHAVDIAICGDGLGYMPAGLNMVIFDPNTLRLVADVRDPEGFTAHGNLVCDASDNTIYVGGDFRPFRMDTRKWRRFISGTYGVNAMRKSRLDPRIIYMGEVDGGVARFDRSTETRLDNVAPPVPSNSDWVFGMAVMANDKKIYATRDREGGIIVIDPARKTILRSIEVGSGYSGVSADIDLDPSEKTLYAAVQDGNRRGLAIISTDEDRMIDLVPLHNAVPGKLGVSPSGKRVFVTTFDFEEGVQSQNALIDPIEKTVLQLFPRPRTGGRWDAQVVFHPHGKYFFVARNMDIDVYLNRE